MKTPNTHQSGFTLVEILAVVGIIAVLASIIVTSIGDSTQAAEEAAINRQAQVLNSALQQYKAAGGEPEGSKEAVIAALRADDSNLISGIKGPFLLDDPSDQMAVGEETRSLIFDGLKFAYISPEGGPGGTPGESGTGGENNPSEDGGEITPPGDAGGDGDPGTGGDTGGEEDDSQIAYNDPMELRGTDIFPGHLVDRPYTAYELDWLAANFDLLPLAHSNEVWQQIGKNMAAGDPNQLAALAPIFAQSLAQAPDTMPVAIVQRAESAYLQGLTGVDAIALLGAAGPPLTPMNGASIANGANAAPLRAMTAEQWDRVLQSEWGGNVRAHLINVLDNGNNLALDEWEKLYYLTELQNKAAAY